jgi:GT2 family glycosyltransferase
VVERHAGAGARRVACAGRGIPLAVNAGLRAASCERVAITHDDCTVEPSWAGRAARLLDDDPDAIVTGRVSPAGDDPASVPATREDPEPHVHATPEDFWAVMPANMAVRRDPFLAFGGFDERFDSAGEDLDMSYRWLAAGGVIRYVPELRVWHHDWRSRRQLRRTYVAYARGCGMFYAKHLRSGDRLMLRYVRRDVIELVWGVGALLLRRHRGRADDRLGALPGLPVGLAVGWWRFRRP